MGLDVQLVRVRTSSVPYTNCIWFTLAMQLPPSDLFLSWGDSAGLQHVLTSRPWQLPCSLQERNFHAGGRGQPLSRITTV